MVRRITTACAVLVALQAGIVSSAGAQARASTAPAVISSLHAQQPNQGTAQTAEVLGAVQWDMTARDGRTFRIFVMPPAGAVPKGDYPVLFVLDGNVQFATAASQALIRALYGETRPAMIVGVGYPFETVDDYRKVPRPRNWDLTPGPPAKPATDGNIHGGADTFYRFINEELRPELKRRYPAASSTDQWLFGHSLAGLFALHTMMNHPSAFRGYIAASPSLWFNPEAQAADENRFSVAIRQGAAFPPLLITVGDKESLDEEVSALAERLRATPGADGQFLFKRLADQSHMSSVPDAVSKAIGFALEKSRAAPASSPDTVQ